MWLKCMNSKFATDKNTEAKHWGEGCFRKTAEENGKTKNASIKNLPHHPVMFSCLNFELKNSNPHQTTYPCICGKTKPRCRESLGLGYCENPQIAGFTLSWSFHWSREREREKEAVILTLVCAWFHCSKEQISILELAKILCPRLLFLPAFLWASRVFVSSFAFSRRFLFFALCRFRV
jgi:hypothetical protein